MTGFQTSLGWSRSQLSEPGPAGTEAGSPDRVLLPSWFLVPGCSTLFLLPPVGPGSSAFPLLHLQPTLSEPAGSLCLLWPPGGKQR